MHFSPRTLPYIGAAAILAVSPAFAQNDECTTAMPIGTGTFAFDTGTATLSPEFWPCAGNGGPDLWYAYTAASTNIVTVETCGSSYDTALEVFSGTCASLVSVQCNDDTCGLQSFVTFTPSAVGEVFYVRVGGFAGSTGTGTLTVVELPPPTQGCVTNAGFESGTFAGWNLTEFAAPFVQAQVTGAGAAGGFGIFFSAPTEGVFSMVCGFDAAGPDILTLSQQVQVTSGLTPLTFDYRAGWDMQNFSGSTLDRTLDVVVRDVNTGTALQTTNIITAMAASQNLDTGNLQGSVDLSMFIGQAVVVSFEINIPEPFTGPGYLEIDNISCPSGGGGIGTNYCGPAVVNSTGMSAEMSATGTSQVSANDLTLVGSNLPQNAFAFFLTSLAQGFVMNPGGSQGNLCLGGAIGRYVGPGQVQQAGSAGEVMLLLDLTMTPTPTGLVSIQAGETWNFTCWFRDAVGGAAVSNFTDGLEVTFL